MYLPKQELVQWRGQIYCPYCIMEIIDEEKRQEEKSGEAARKKQDTKEKYFSPPPFNFSQGVEINFKCDKCENESNTLYIVADHKFCSSCYKNYVTQLKIENLPEPPHIKIKKPNKNLLQILLDSIKDFINREWKKRIKEKDKD